VKYSTKAVHKLRNSSKISVRLVGIPADKCWQIKRDISDLEYERSNILQKFIALLCMLLGFLRLV